MNVRPASIADLDRLEALDASYTTDHIWQVDQTVSSDQIAIGLRRVRIPRSLCIAYPKAPDNLFDHWRRRECFLVAVDAGSPVGYLDMTVDHEEWRGWIQHLIVHKPYRRQRVANLLLQGAERWAAGSELRSVTVALQSKNDPAIQLMARAGYRFAGVIDRYFANGDVGVLYSRELPKP